MVSKGFFGIEHLKITLEGFMGTRDVIQELEIQLPFGESPWLGEEEKGQEI